LQTVQKRNAGDMRMAKKQITPARDAQLKRLARRIARGLLLDWTGEIAFRLVREHRDSKGRGHYGGTLEEPAITRYILQVLRNAERRRIER